MDKDSLIEKIGRLMSGQLEGKNDFVLFYSNEEKIMDCTSLNLRELSGLISTQTSSIEVPSFVELDNISTLIEKYIQREIKNDEEGYPYFHLINDYEYISFDCFVGNDFFYNDYHNSVVARALIANSLIQNNYNIEINYYSCGANYSDSTIKLDSQYTITTKPNIIR